VTDPLVARTLELLQSQVRTEVSAIKLFGASTRIPPRFEGGDHSADLVEIDPIGSRIRTCIGRIFDPALGNNLCDDLGDIAYAVILAGLTDVERLIEYTLRRSL